MMTDQLDFHLPAELIAQTPSADRGGSKLLHYSRSDQSVIHRQFQELPKLLRAGDLLIFNNARVVPARFTLQKPTGGQVEALFIAQTSEKIWTVLLKNLGRVKPGLILHFIDAPQITARVLSKKEEGHYELAVDSDQSALDILSRIGRMPLPPYIKRDKQRDERDDFDRQRYQTVYAKASGSIAAPTAGLHFTEQVLQELDQAGVQRTFVTLDVGLGTFKPVSVADLKDHAMHSETYTIDPTAAEMLNQATREHRRIIAVGTTSARVLESQPAGLPIEAKTSSTSIFIYPPYHWKHVNALITNFHLPRSTLIALVAAMVGIEEQRRLYELAIAKQYRFFSYGDSMFIE